MNVRQIEIYKEGIMKRILCGGLILYFIFLSDVSFSAPIKQFPPMAIEGTIQEISWHPDKFVKGKYSTGTLGMDRTIPAYYKITLTDTVIKYKETNSDEGYIPISYGHKSGDIVTVTINHESDDGFLKEGMRIKIYDYQVAGDEGGSWTFFEKIEIIKK